MRTLTLSAGLLAASAVVALPQMPFINGVVDSARLGGRLAPGFAGLYQVNFQIPPGAPPGDDVTVTVSLPGAPADTATLAIRK